MARKPTRLGLTRDQFASFLSDFEQIKQFEQLFASVDQINNFSIDEVSIAADNAGAAANEAQAGVDRLQDDVYLTSLAPVIENNTSETTNYLDFRTTISNVAPHIGRLFWNGGQTLSLYQTLNVAGKINEDNFYYIKADSAIAKGQLIKFTGSVGASGVLRGAPATALGINDGVRLMGVAAEAIAANGFGMVQWSGTLRGFNTTGSPYGETWVDGDILYYNPAFAGGLTKVEPTAPNVRAVIAAVINAASAGSGSISIRLSVGSVLGGTDSNVYINALTGGDLLQYDGADQRWENIAASSVTIGTATNLAGGAANRIAYQTATGVTGFIVAPTSANTFLEWSGSAFQWSSNPLGTVTSVSVVSANGLAGTVANATTTPAITLSTTVTGIVKGNGTALSAASAGTDYVAPGAITTSGLTMATARLLGRTTASTGAVEEITVGTGLSLTAGTLSNSAPDQTVVLTAGTGISTSGTYPNFTITNTAPDQVVSLTAGTGISISGAYPSFTVTNSAPDQIISLTGAGTTVVTGTYPSFTITSNDQYVGTVTSVSGTGSVNGITLTGTVTSSGSLTLGGTLSNVSLTTQVTGTLPVGSGGTGTATAFTTGSIVFAGASGIYAQDNANLNWDDTNNTLGVGRTAASNVRVYSKGGTTGGGAFSYYGENSAGTGCFGIRDDGAFYTGAASLSPYNLTTAAAANLVVAADYYLYRSTSSARYKKNIVDYDRGLAAAMSLRPVYYEGRGEIDEGKRFAGFVAEEVYDSGLTEFVVLDEEGKPDALHYGNMTALLASAIKELGKRLERIEAALGIEDGDNS